MTVEVLGDIVLTFEYWDCECAKNYIHPHSENKCRACNAIRSDQPSSRVNEVLAARLPLNLKSHQHLLKTNSKHHTRNL